MKGYGRAAVAAARALASQPGIEPRDAWKIAMAAEFPDSESLREKACPRTTFLGLCQAGKVPAVPSGKYTSSSANASYALTAIQILRKDAALSQAPEKLWALVIGNSAKRHNSQMDVVTALWNNHLISE